MKRIIPPTSHTNLRVFTSCLLSFLMIVSQFAAVAGSLRAAEANRVAGSKLAADQKFEASLFKPNLGAPSSTTVAPSLAEAQPTKVTSGNRTPFPGVFYNLMPAVTTVTATKLDSFLVAGDDSDSDGKADPGDKITYTVNIGVSGADATGVTFNDTVHAHTTFVPGSFNISPLANNDSYDTIANTLLEVGPVGAPSSRPKVTVTGSVFDNDTEFMGDSFTLKTLQAVNFVSGTVTATSTNGGTIVMDGSGKFSFTPKDGSTVADTFTYTITDDGPDNIAGNADDLSNTATVTINVTAPRIWYVDNTVAVTGLGRSSDPFKTLAEAQAKATAVGDYVYVFTGSGNTGQNAGFTFQANNQQLLGEGVALSIPVSVNGGANPTLLRAAGTKPSIGNSGGNGVTAGNLTGIVIRGLTIAGSTNGIAVTWSTGGNSVTINTNSLSGTTGNGLDVTTTATTVGGGTATISNNTISAAGAEGIDINGQGTGGLILALDSETVTSTGSGIDINGTTGGVTLTSFAGNAISGASGANGVLIQTATFDSNTVTGGLQPLTAGSLNIGASGAGNGVGGNGLVMFGTLTGTLPFTTLSIFSDNGRGIDVTGSGVATTGLTASSGATISATNGAAVWFTGGTTIDLQNALITSTNSPDNGVNLSSINGTFSATASSSISNATGDDFVVGGSGTANITWNASLSNSTGNSVDVSGHTGGTIAFTGAIGDTGQGINLNSNTGTTINFTGGLNIASTTFAAFTATGGGTVNVCNEAICNPNANGAVVNTLTTTTGTALNVANTTIGSNKLEFKSISAGTAASGPANAIILNNTGSIGGLTVTGDGNASQGGNSSGGTIQKTTSHGISLTNTDNVSLTNMTIQNTSGSGIDGTLVTNFSFDNGTITGSGDAVFESNIAFNDDSVGNENNIDGTLTVTDSILNTAFDGGLDVRNGNGTISNATITNNSLTSTNSTATSKGSGIRLEHKGTASVVSNLTKATITGNSVNKFPSGAGIKVLGGNANAAGPSATIGDNNSATNFINISSNAVSGESAAVRMGTNAIETSVNGKGIGHIVIDNNNPLQHVTGVGASLSAFGNVTVKGKITNNTIIANNGFNSSGIAAGADQTFGTTDVPNLTLQISGNNVSAVQGNGILTGIKNTNGTASIKVLNNVIAAPTVGARPGIRADAGTNIGGNTTLCLEMSGNTTAGSGGFPGIGIREETTNTNTLNIVGLSPSPANPNQTEDYLGTQNPASAFGAAGFSNDGLRTVRAIVLAGTSFSSCASFTVMNEQPDPTGSDRVEVARASQLAKEWPTAVINYLFTHIDEAIKDNSDATTKPSQALAEGNNVLNLVLALMKKGSETTPTNVEHPASESGGTRDNSVALAHSSSRREDTGSSAVKGRKSATQSMREAKTAKAHAAPAMLMPSGDVLPTANIGTVKVGQSVTIRFAVTLDTPPNLDPADLVGGPHVRNQGTVSGSNFSNVLTDDTALGGASDPTDTPVDLYNVSVGVVTSKPGPTFMVEGESVTFTATITETPAQTPDPSGSVTFYDGAAILANQIAGCVNVPLSGGTAQCTTTALTAAGSPHTITAQYNGDGNFDINTGTVSQTVNPCTSNPVVTSIADNGVGSLRNAIAIACVGSTISFDTAGVFATPQTITLTSGELLLTKNLTIDGPDAIANRVTISGGGTSRVFNIQPGKTNTIRDLTVTGGIATSGVYPANAGGGILNDHGTLTLINMTISGNTGFSGGGLYNNGTTGGSASLTIINSTLSGNTATDDGGAISNNGGGAGATVVVNNSTISGNNAVGNGGGLVSIAGTVTTTNVTITNNHSDSDDNTVGDGGGVNFLSGTNVLRNTIVAGNFKGSGTSTPNDISGSVDTTVASSNNLIGTGGTGGLTAINGNQINVANPGLGPLASNGGLAQTHALLFGSPAIEGGNNTFSDAVGLTTDQRGTGFIRKADSADANTTQTVDIGAMEVQASVEDITDKTTPEDTALGVNFNVGDGAQITSVTATSSNTTLVPNANLVITGGPGSTRLLTITPASNLFGMTTITVTVTSGSESMQDTFVLTVTAVADLPSVTGASTTEDTQTASGLVITRNAADGAEVTHFKITSITNGTLFKNDGTTQINNNDFITEAEGNAGLKFTPAANSSANGSFQVQASLDGVGTGLSSAATATITVSTVADTPSVTNSTTNEDTQTTLGLVISRNAGDGAEVTHFKITGITNGTLFLNNGTTQINNNDFITFAQGNAGLKFTPAANLFSPATTPFAFTVQASTSNVDGGLGGSTATATITVSPVGDTPSVTNSSTNEDTQTTTGLVIDRNAVDGAEVTHFKITSITNGTLFKNDGTTPIPNNSFITFAEGNAGLKFTPTANFSGNGSFQVQAGTDGVGGGLSAGFATATITVGSVADVPTVTPATTNEDTQTAAGLVITKNVNDGVDVTHFKITNITNGTLFQNNGTTQINNGDFITLAQGGAGLKFTPTANLYSSVSTFGFDVQGATSAGGAGLGNAATASITVNPIADTPSVTNTTTAINTQSTTGLVISRNAADGAEVTHFKITNITNGTLFQNDGTTPINNNDFITFAQGNAGLKFTPGNNLTDPTVFGFDVQASLNNTNGGIGGGTAHATINVNCTSPQVVTSILDDGSAGTLRYAIINVCPVGTITFNLPAGPQTITLGSSLTINKDVTIIGPASQRVTVSGNSANRVLSITTGNVNISNLTFSGGLVSGGNGGGILATSTGTLTLTGMTINGNTADNGGGIATTAGTINIYNSTISGNTATVDGGGVWHNTAGTVNFVNSTVTSNNATGQGGGLRAAGGTTNIKNTIIAGNTATTNADVGGVIVDQGNNLLTGDPKLSPLANNGGPTMTHALKPGSPALDAGDNTAANNAGLAGDQRGTSFVRIRDAASDADTTATVDIGSFEADPSVEDITDKSTPEDTALPSFSFKVADTVSAFDSITATSSNTTLVPNGNISLTGSGSTRNLDITPAANQSGTTTITVTVTKTISGTQVSMVDTFVLTVGSIPDTPSVTNSATSEDTQTTSGLVITKNAVDGADVTHFKITNITGGTLFKNDGVTIITNNSFITEAEGNAGLKFTPAANSFANGSFQVQSSTDAVGTSLSPGAATATILVAGVADTPSVTNATTNEDTQTTSGLVITRNAADGAEVTHFKITGITNGTLFKNNGTTQINNNDFITFAEGNAGLKFTPSANLSSPGTTFSFQVQASLSNTNGGLGGSLATATITVNTVADTPSVTNASTLEDQQTTSGLVISRNAADGVEVTHFQITGITGGTLFQNNGTTAINNNDFITVAQGNAGLKFTPTANSSANGSFQVQASLNNTVGGLGGSLATATITVTAVNDAPTLDPLGNVVLNEDDPLQTVNLAGISAGGGETQTLVVTASSNNTGLIPNPTVNYTSPNATGSLSFTPVANQSGSAVITVTVNDGGGTANGGVETVVRTFTVTVNAVNDAPVNGVPGPQSVVENTTLTFSAANSNLISIADVDAAAASVQVQLTVTSGTFSLSGIGGLSFTVGDGTSDTTMTFTGTIANINAALSGLVYTPTAGFDGAATLQIITNDQGNTGSGGAKSDTDTVNISVLDGGVLAFSSATYTVAENGGTATITVNRTGGTAGTTTINYATSNGSAASGSDYTTASGTLTFTNGVSSQTFTVPITSDTLDETNETVNLTLSAVTGSGVLGAQSTAVLTITDDDPPPGISINDVSVTEGNAGTTNATFTISLSAASGQTVTVSYVTADGTATAPSDYTAIPSTLLTFNPGETTKTVTVLVNGDTLAEANETFFVNLSGATNSTITDNQGVGLINSDDTPVMQFNSSTQSVNEGAGHIVVTVTRLGDLGPPARINYATSDVSGLNECAQITGSASQRCDYATVVGTLRFGAGEGTKDIVIPIVDDVHIEGNENFTLTLSNAVGGDIGTPSTMTITIVDNDSVPAPNPISNDAFFIRQLYIDLLGRLPEPGAVNSWLAILNNCAIPSDPVNGCDRIAVAAGFLRSAEFQGRGFFVYRHYSAVLGRIPLYTEFIPDMALVNGFLSNSDLEANKVAYTDIVMNRAEFHSLYDSTINNPTAFVDKLLQVSNLPNHPTRNTWIAGLTNSTLTRAQVVRQFIDSTEVNTKYVNEAFIIMNYFGFLRRSADGAYQAWFTIFNNTNDYRLIINGFMNSAEYRLRFGPTFP